MSFALFQPTSEPLPVAAVARALALIPRLAASDAARVARAAHGVLLDGLSEAEADAALPALAEHGVQRGDQAWLEPLTRFTTRRLRLANDALVALDAYGAETALAWSDVLLISCAELPDDRPGRVPDERPADLAAAVLGIPESSTRTRLVLELVVKGPVRRYRIEANGFDYACLGDRKQPSAARNFRPLLEQLAQQSAAAQLNQCARELLTHGRGLRFDDEAQLERETGFWLWKLHAGDLVGCERAPRTAGSAAAELDPAVLLAASKQGLGRARGGLRLAHTLASLLVLVIIGWLLYLLNRLSTTGFEAPP